MNISINKEIRDYSESVVFGLNMRQFVFSILIVATLAGCYAATSFLASDIPILRELLSWVCIVLVAPFALLGFFKYNEMPFEQLALAWIKSELLTPKQLVYKTDMSWYEDVMAMVLTEPEEMEEIENA